MRYWSFGVVLVAVAAFSATSRGQVSSGGLISPEAARPLGLERMWSTQLDLDRGRGRLAGLHLHVSGSEAHTVFEIVHSGKRYAFSQRDRNPFGEEIGVEGAKQKADEKLAEITKELQAAGKANAKPLEILTHIVPKITLYATSERGLIQALDAETGRTRWSENVGNPMYPTTAPCASDKYVGLCNGSTVYVLKAADGVMAWSRACMSSPGAGPAVSDELVFVPMITGTFESFYVDDPKRPLPTYKSFGRALVQPVLSYNSVAWPTDAGNLYVGFAHVPGMRFRLHTQDPISSAPAFLPPDKVFATSMDGYIYCVHENRGNVTWRFTTGEPISHSPVALGKMVYAITNQGNLFAVDAALGVEMWVATGIKGYVAGNERRLYCTDTRGNLTVLDATTGSRMGTIAAAAFDFPLINAQTDRIILASATGRLQCFREANSPFPVVHYRYEPAKTAQPTKTPTPKPEEKTEPTPTPVGDPFADPLAPGGKAAPKAAEPKPAEAGADPFAAPPGKAP